MPAQEYLWVTLVAVEVLLSPKFQLIDLTLQDVDVNNTEVLPHVLPTVNPALVVGTVTDFVAVEVVPSGAVMVSVTV